MLARYNNLNIVVKKSNQLSENEWSLYTEAFNEVFNKHYLLNHFKQKYLTTVDNCSYHAILIQNEKIVGSCSAIPYQYFLNNQIIRIALIVDLFILESYRSNPYTVYNLYKKLKEYLKKKNITLIVAVPNDMAYPYWKNVVKWKDIGCLDYFALPINVANITKNGLKILNRFSKLAATILLTFSRFIISTEKNQKIRINRDIAAIEKQRYTEDHKIIKSGKSYFSYRIVNEDNVKACYLIDFYNIDKKKRDSFSLYEAVKYIKSKEEIDLIIFVGKLSFLQCVLIRVPFKMEPKHLYLMTDILIPDNIKNTDLIYNMKNWDFGLYNYDVR